MASNVKKNGRHDGPQGENDVLAQFISVTGASEEVAQNMLEACNNELDMAIGMYLDSGLAEDGGGGGAVGGRSGGGRSSAGISSNSSPKRNSGRRRSKTKSPTEDEAFEDGEDFVRAPIPQKMEQLVDDMVIVNPKRIPSIASTKVRSVFDGFRDFRREAEEQQRAMLSGESSATNASQSSSSSSSSTSSTAFGKKPSKKLKTLEELFRPPVDMLYPGTFIGAREEGKAGNLWLLINIQNHKEFACQCLNRDIWSHGAIRDIVKQHFVFWQVYHDSAEGVKYEQFYPIGQYPYVAVLDPRTGERLLTINKFDALSFSETMTEFLREHPSPDGTSHASNGVNLNRSNFTATASTSSTASTSQNPFATASSSASSSSPPGKRKLDSDSSASRGESSSSSCSTHPEAKKGRFTAEAALESILDESEDSQLQAAIRASLAENASGSKKSGKSGKDSSSSPSKNKRSNVDPTRPVEESETTESDEEGSETEGELETFSSSEDEGEAKDSPKETTTDSAPVAVCERSESSVASKGNEAKSLDSSNNESADGDDTEDDDDDVVNDDSLTEDAVVGDSDGWRRWCASETSEGTKTKIIFRLPDGARDQLELVAEAPLLALALFANSKGFSAERFELVTNFPRKKLSYMDGDSTLKAVGIIGQETVFVQEREIPLAK